MVSAGTAVVGAYLCKGREHVLNWGATRDEASGDLPGDEILGDATLQTTRAITVKAPPEAIWPWLMQMGPKPRAGVYTYDWIERLVGIDVESSDRILPEFQHMEADQFLRLNEKGENGLTVRVVDEPKALVLQWTPATSTWAFVLRPQPDGTTRLLSRNRIPGSGLKFWAGMVALMEPGSLVMERKMLLGIKERAERLAKEA